MANDANQSVEGAKTRLQKIWPMVKPLAFAVAGFVLVSLVIAGIMSWHMLMWNSPVIGTRSTFYAEVPQALLPPEKRIAWASTLNDTQRGMILAPLLVKQFRHYVEVVGLRSNDSWLIYSRDRACESGYGEPGGVWQVTLSALETYLKQIARFGPGSTDDPVLAAALAKFKFEATRFGWFWSFASSHEEYTDGFNLFDDFMTRLAAGGKDAKNTAEETDIVKLLAAVFGEAGSLDTLYSRVADVDKLGRKNMAMSTYSLVCGSAVAADVVRGVKTAYANYFKPNSLALLDRAVERLDQVAELNIPFVLNFPIGWPVSNHPAQINGILGPAFDGVAEAARALPQGIQYFK